MYFCWRQAQAVPELQESDTNLETSKFFFNEQFIPLLCTVNERNFVITIYINIKIYLFSSPRDMKQNQNWVRWEKRRTVCDEFEQDDDTPEFRLLLFVLLDDTVSVDVLHLSASKERRCVAIASRSADVIVRTGAWSDTGKSVCS
jgi:hypothetical protein